MTLATHGIIGAAAAALIPTAPPLGFLLAFASHFTIDSFPHRDYELRSLTRGDTKLENDMTFGPAFAFDLVRTGTDATIGLIIAMLVFAMGPLSISPEIVMLGVIGGVLPDVLQLVYFKTRPSLLLPLQRFHIRIQEGKDRPHWPLWKGLLLQAGLVSFVIAAVYFVSL